MSMNIQSSCCLLFVFLCVPLVFQVKSSAMERDKSRKERSDTNMSRLLKNITELGDVGGYRNGEKKMENETERIPSGKVMSRKRRSEFTDQGILMHLGKWRDSHYFISEFQWVWSLDKAENLCEAFDAHLAEIGDYEEKLYLSARYYRSTGNIYNCWGNDPLFYISPARYNPEVGKFQYKYSGTTIEPGIYNGRFGTDGEFLHLALYGHMQIKELEFQQTPMPFICEAHCPNWFFCRV